jgi:hypothetical protein
MALAPIVPRPAIADHPAFPLMLLRTLERFHCSLAVVREDYWRVRVWRALTADDELAGRVARLGVGTVLMTGQDFGPAPASARERAHWRLRVEDRIAADTGRMADMLDVGLQWAETPVRVVHAPVTSLIAQTIGGGTCWDDLARYTADLAPVRVPVAQFASHSIAA